MPKSFKARLKILMGDDRPYTFARKVGIDKGLFQYYWQMEKIPTYLNLIKIQEYTGCSIDWLLTGKIVAFEKIDTPKITKKNPRYKALNSRLSKTIKKLKIIYSKKSDTDIDSLEQLVDAI